MVRGLGFIRYQRRFNSEFMKVQFYTVKEVAARYNLSVYCLKKMLLQHDIVISGRFVYPKQLQAIINVFGNVD